MPEIRNLLIVLMLFSGVIIGMSSFYGSLTDPTNLAYYGMSPGEIANISPQDLSSSNITDEITQKVEDMETTMQQKPTGVPIIDYGWSFVNTALEALNLMLSSSYLFVNLITDTVAILGIPPWIIGIAVGVVLIIVMLEILSARLKWKV